MPELTIEALQHFMIENGCKVKSTDAIEFFRNNFVHSINDVSANKDLFKQYMEELTSAQISDNGDRYLVLKRQHMVYVNSPYCTGSPRLGDVTRSLSSPRTKRSQSEYRPKSPGRFPRSPKLSEQPRSLPAVLSNRLVIPGTPTDNRGSSPSSLTEEDGYKSPVSGFETGEDEYDSEDDLSDMELGSVGACSHNQLEPNQKEWIYKTAIGDLDSVTRLLLQDTEKTLVKYKDFISGYTGLHWACKLGRVDMAQVLIVSGSDVNSKAFNGMTPLHLAAQCGYDPIIDILIENKADKYTRDYNGKYPVYYISNRCTPKTRELLTPPIVTYQKPRYMVNITDPTAHPSSNSSKQDAKTFTLRRHKRERSDTSDRSKTLANNFKYQSLSKNSNHKRPLSGLRIDHISLDMNGSEGVTIVQSKEEALESLSSPTMSPRSCKRRSLGTITPLNYLHDNEPLLLCDKSNVVMEEETVVVKSNSKLSLLCCCPNRKRQSSV